MSASSRKAVASAKPAQVKATQAEPPRPLAEPAMNPLYAQLIRLRGSGAAGAGDPGEERPGYFEPLHLQRQCAACSASETQEDEALRVQRRTDPESSETGPAGEPAAALVEQTLGSGEGRPLDDRDRAYFEPRFGQDLGHVRLHTSSRAAASARAVGAQAYAVGRDIVLGQPGPDLGTLAGRRLLAHELAHVVQQAPASPKTRRSGVSSLTVSHPDDPAEREADRVADVVTRGPQIPPGLALLRSGPLGLPYMPRVGPLASVPLHLARALPAGAGKGYNEFSACVGGLLGSLVVFVGEGILAIFGAMTWRDMIETQLFVETMCACLPDEAILEIARSASMASGGLASKHLDHYLRGSGADYAEDLREILRSDTGVRNKLTLAIIEAGKQQPADHPATGLDGHAVIDQADYSVREYQLSFGAIGRMNFWVDDSPDARAYNREAGGKIGLVQVNFRDLYQWHPDAQRKTKCIHEAAVRLKKMGAKDFWMVGSARVALELPPKVVPQ
jgi:Domain of unknown function (DUF4157)